MIERNPVAFLSYVRSDDAHDRGRISELRELLEGEVRMQTGHAFPIFQDRNDIAWGDEWMSRIKGAINSISFLIPVLTPSFFKSKMCREEFDAFLLRERELGIPRLILPIYYVTSDEIEAPSHMIDDMSNVLRSRNWADWRELRFSPLDLPVTRVEIAKLAQTIKQAMTSLQIEIEASEANLQRKSQQIIRTALVTQETHSTSVASQPELNTIPVARSKRRSKRSLTLAQRAPYYIYTSRYDEEIRPNTLGSGLIARI